MSKTFAAYFLFLPAILGAYISQGQATALRVPAEWEMQEGVFVTYGGVTGVDPFLARLSDEAIGKLIKGLANELHVTVLVEGGTDEDSLKRIFKKGRYNLKNIKIEAFYALGSTGLCRDYGPIIAKGFLGERKIVRFGWGAGGYDFNQPGEAYRKKTDKVRDPYYAKMGKLLKMEIVSSPLAIEGGEIETNGEGTILLVESFTKRRNPKIAAPVFDSLLNEIYGKSKIIWLKEGAVEDPGPGGNHIAGNTYGIGMGGHIDEFARFVNSNTIFLAFPDTVEASKDSIKKKMLDRMNTNYSILASSAPAGNQQFNIVKIPVPDVIPLQFYIDTFKKNYPILIEALLKECKEIRHGGSIKYIPAVSYLNFVAANNLVLIPKYWRRGFPASCKRKDRVVKKIFRQYYPGKKIIQVDVWGLNFGAGGMHCWTQQIPQ